MSKNAKKAVEIQEELSGTVENVLMVVRDEEAAPEAVKETPRPLSLQEIKEKIRRLERAREAHDELIQKVDELEAFKVNLNTDNCTLRIHNGAGASFSSSDSGAILSMVEICISRCKMQAHELETILNF